MRWEKVIIFISSTFNDMHAERDYLVKNVFPELREWCENRKIHLVDVDLRWGVTEDDSNSNHTVLACLNNIDESRPFFLCFLGQRRGWIPEEVSPETLNEYPDVSNVLGKSSVTEMEIEHALLSPMLHLINGIEKYEVPVNHSLFYFRNPDYLTGLTVPQKIIFTNSGTKDEPFANSELDKFKKKITDNWNYTTEYNCVWDKSIISPELLKIRDNNNNITDRTDGAEQGRLTGFNVDGIFLKDIIIEQLKVEIQKEFPNRTNEFEYSSDLERDLDQQELFIELNGEGFIAREGDFDDLHDYLTNDSNNLFVLAAPAGYGKTMLLANFIKSKIDEYKARIFSRFCGASDLCSQQYTLWKTIFDEANIECPDTLDDIKDNIKDLLYTLAEEKTVLIIDAINQLPDGLDMLEWLPKKLPENLKIILSVKADEELKKDESICYSYVKPFKSKGEKEKLIRAYLKKYLKALDDTQISAICTLDGSENPLYLKILLSELRVFGSFDQLIDKIREFGETPKDAFKTVLNRLERDINSLKINSAQFAPALFGFLASARNGLSETELKSCIHETLPFIEEENLLSAIRLFIRQVKPFMVRREGRSDYFYDSFKLAAKERYADIQIRCNEILADYFKKQADPKEDLSFWGENIRDFNELPYHLVESNNIACLEKLFTAYLWIKRKTELSDINNTISDYQNYLNKETEENYHIALIKNTLILSHHILLTNKKELPTQLYGRLKDIKSSKFIEMFLEEIDNHETEPWLKPYHYMGTAEGALKVILKGHENSINAVSFSFDGKYIVSSSDDGTVRVWDWKKQKEVSVLKGDWKHAICACFSLNDETIAFGTSDSTVRVWDWKKNVEFTKLVVPTSSIGSVAFSQNGEYIVLCSGDNTVRVWDWQKRIEVSKFDEHSGTVWSVGFHPNGDYIVSGSNDGTICVWNWKRNELVSKLTGHNCVIHSVNFSPDGNYVVSCSGHPLYREEDNTVRVWDWENQREIAKYGLERSVILSTRFSPDGENIVFGSWHDETVYVWNWKNGKIRNYQKHTEKVNCVNFSPDGEYIVSCSKDKTIRVWSWDKEDILEKLYNATNYMSVTGVYDKKGETWKPMMGHPEFVADIDFSPDGRYIVSCAGNRENTIIVWDRETHFEKKRKHVSIMDGKGHGYLDAVGFSPDGEYVIYNTSIAKEPALPHTINRWSIAGFPADESIPVFYLGNLISHDGNYTILRANENNKIFIWDWNEKDCKGTIEEENGIMSAILSSDCEFVATGLHGGVIHIWNWKKQEIIAELKGKSEITHVLFSPDDQYIGTGLCNGTIDIWDWKKEEVICKYESDLGVARRMRFTPDGHFMVFNYENIICVLNLRKHNKSSKMNITDNLVISHNTEESINGLAISSDALYLATGGEFGQVLVYGFENLSTETP